MTPIGSSRRAAIGLLAGFGVFLIIIAYLVASSLAPRAVVEFALTPLAPRVGPVTGLVVDTVTLDASDETRWRFFSFTRGTAVEATDPAGWDLAFRRFHVLTSGAVRDLGAVPWDSIVEAPVDGYSETHFGTDTVNPVLERWYRYSFFSHVLTPKNHVYVVRTATGRYVRLQFLGYYCTGTLPGCITLRYALQGDGRRSFR